MKTIDKIIELFINKKTPKTIREIAKQIGSDYRITYTAVQRLLENKILLSTVVGKSTLCELNNLFYGTEIYFAETARRENLLQRKMMRQLYKEIMYKLTTSFFVCLVFGSYAKGSITKSSDIDLMFISNEKGFEKRIEEISSLLPLPLHNLVFTEDEFVRMKNSRRTNVVTEAIENNVILFGIENYYRMKNA